MKIRGHGTAVAVVVSVLALAVAGGGTAVAVSTVVSIADPSTPSRVARVDQFGRLTVATPTGTINAAGYLYGYADATVTQLTSPTTATLAITRLQLSNPSANAGATEQQISISKYAVDGAGNCTATTAPTLLARYDLAAGDDVDDVFPAALVVKPTGGTRYCLYATTDYLGSASATPAYYLVYGLTAYPTVGNYTGIGTGAPAPAAAAQPRSARIGG